MLRLIHSAFVLQDEVISPICLEASCELTPATCNTTPSESGYFVLRLPLAPSKTMEKEFWNCAGAARFSYNWCINRWNEHYKAGEKCGRFSIQKDLGQLKRLPEFKWLARVSKCIPQLSIQAVDSAYKNFFRRLKTRKPGEALGAPKFKRRDKATPAFAFTICPNEKHPLRGRGIKLPKLGVVPIARRHFEDRIPDGGRIIRITVKHDGKCWHAALLFKIPVSLKSVAPAGPTIGIDLGLTHFATLSDGRVIDAPKPLAKAIKKLKWEDRKLCRRKRGSGRRSRQRKKVAAIHRNISNIRNSFLHGLSAALTKNHGQLGIESLNVGGMLKNKYLARSISDAGWGEFRRQLRYKCRRSGAVLVEHDTFFASSKLCSSCGVKNETLKLSEREWRCERCGVLHDRDVNAAKNLSPANCGEVRVEDGVHRESEVPSVET